jgi:GNAT superfamily N-acetyltransferase
MPYQIRPPANIGEWRDYYLLRWRILRAPERQPQGSEQDELENVAWHLAGFDGGRLIATGRLHRSVQPQTGQIRYMAVAADYQCRGVGTLLLQGLEDIARGQDMALLILNAREQAAPFYQRAGYYIQGEGPLLFGHIRHWLMQKQVN